MAISDDNIDWDRHWIEHKNDADFTDVKAFDYFLNLLPENFEVLDIGCGTCKWYPAFKTAGCRKYVGLDFSEVAIKIAREKFPDLKTLLMKAEEMDFNSEFDLVFTHTFLQHTNIETKRKLFPRIYKALKRNGLLVIQEKCDVDTLTTFTKENWVKFIEQFGFKFLRGTPEGDPRNGFVFKVL